METRRDRFNAKMTSIWKGARLLACTIPGPIVATYVLAITYMNFFAIKEFPISTIAVIDCAFLLSWIPFLITDMVTKALEIHAAISLAIFGCSCNVVFSVFLWFVTLIPSSLGIFSDKPQVQTAIESVFGGSHLAIIFGSALSLFVAIVVKSLIIWNMDKKYNEDEKMSVKIFYKEVAISSLVGQLVDNSIFAFFSAYLLFHWDFNKIFWSVIIKTALELVMEMLCLPMGYMRCSQCKEDGICEKYMNFIAEEKAKKLKQN